MDDEIEVEVSLPLDADGFLRRECPHCMQEFKWHNGPANEEAEQQPPPSAYHCPLCGQPAAVESWYTQEQVRLIESIAEPQVMRAVEDEIEAMFRGMKGVTYKRGQGSPPSEVADPLVEPDDMTIIASPCHSYEPVKVPDDASGPFHCLVCGSAFAV